MKNIGISFLALVLSSVAFAGGNGGKCEKMGKVTKAKTEAACTKAGGKWVAAAAKAEKTAEAPKKEAAPATTETPATEEAPATTEEGTEN